MRNYFSELFTRLYYSCGKQNPQKYHHKLEKGRYFQIDFHGSLKYIGDYVSSEVTNTSVGNARDGDDYYVSHRFIRENKTTCVIRTDNHNIYIPVIRCLWS